MPFNELGLTAELSQALKASAYQRPTAIQVQSIPVILAGRDVAGTAQTGTGKTAAFVLPMLQRLGASTGKLRALILTPTRELAVQVEASIRKYGRFTKLRSTAIYGGVSQKNQEEALKKGVDIIVATPGRFLDLLNQRLLNLSTIEILTLDEADRMLDMGFLPDIREIVRHVPKERQTLLFTATLPPEVLDLTRSVQSDPVLIQAGEARTPAAGIDQVFYPVPSHLKNDLLLELLERETMQPLLVFTKTKHGADRLHSLLERRRFKVARIHSGRTQSQRQAALESFKKSHCPILIATDIVARGIDVQNISHVINFDLPNNVDDYIHRIGRTARAEKVGMAYSFVSPEDEATVRLIEKTIRRKLARIRLDGFDYDAPVKSRVSRTEPSVLRQPFSAERTAPKNGSPKVFDRFAHGLAAAHRKPRPNGGSDRRPNGKSEWVEGRIGIPSDEERAELKRLQIKIFGTSNFRRNKPRSSFRTGHTRDRY
ncbi:MAG: DEAD/DEAH box helicase [Acidobacteriota bacterium]